MFNSKLILNNQIKISNFLFSLWNILEKISYVIKGSEKIYKFKSTKQNKLKTHIFKMKTKLTENKTIETLYHILKVDDTVTEIDLKKAYHKLCLRFHP